MVFAACAFPVYTWSMLAFFDKLPSWLLFLSTWELVSVLAYSLVFALFESSMLLLCLVILARILPGRLLRDKFATLGSMIVLVTAVWAIAVQLNVQAITSWPMRALMLWGGVYLGSIGIAFYVILRHGGVERAWHVLVDRLVVLLYLYLPVTFFSIIVVVVRNLGWARG